MHISASWLGSDFDGLVSPLPTAHHPPALPIVATVMTPTVLFMHICNVPSKQHNYTIYSNVLTI